MPDSPTSKTESDFVCACEVWMRSACEGEQFYEEHEGKRYCLFHYPGSDKRKVFMEALRARLDDNFNFRGFWFPDWISFHGVDFTSTADFSGATFSEGVSFYQVTFSTDVNLSSVNFAVEADFRLTTFSTFTSFANTTFNALADFSHATFGAHVSFSDVVFDAGAIFTGATFNANVEFTAASFKALADFGVVTFGAFAGFTNTTFDAAAIFHATTFVGAAHFYSSTFSAKAYFRSVKFGAAADFRGVVFSAAADFRGATFTADTDFSGVSFRAATEFSFRFIQNASFNSAIFADNVRFSGAEDGQLHTDETCLDLQFARIEKPNCVSFHTVMLRPHWFENVDSREFEFINVAWNWDSINDEVEKYHSWSPNPLLALACRNLAVNAEENHRYEEASRFRYLAMDLKRRETWFGFDFRRLGWWYWLASGYGERVLRAFLVLLGIWLVAGLLYTQVGFARWEPRLADEADTWVARKDDVGAPLKFSRALTYSAAVMTFQRPEPKPASIAAQTVVLLETILGPVQAALLALAIRRKFMR